MKPRKSAFEPKKMWTLASIKRVAAPSLCVIAMPGLLLDVRGAMPRHGLLPNICSHAR
jgi:hypothetical protein